MSACCWWTGVAFGLRIQGDFIRYLMDLLVNELSQVSLSRLLAIPSDPNAQSPTLPPPRWWETSPVAYG